MGRKSLIICLATLVAMFVALGVAIAFLYSGTGSVRKSKVSYDGAYVCLPAVPSDAVLVSCFERSDVACRDVLSGIPFVDSLHAGMSKGSLESLRRSSMAVSLHYSGKLTPLFIWEASGVSVQTAEELISCASGFGLQAERKDGFLMVSESETLLKSASRHIDGGLSIVDAQGFDDAMESIEGSSLLFLSHLHAQKLMTAVVGKNVARHSTFIERTADWSTYSINAAKGGGLSLHGVFGYDSDADEFMTVLENCTPAVPEVGDLLPSYTMFAVTLPVRNPDDYMCAYQSFVDSRQKLPDFKAVQKTLGNRAGVMPEDFFRRLDVREVACAMFKVAGKMEKVNLMHVGNKDVSLIFKGNDVSSLRGYAPAVHNWAYQGFAASVFGKQFSVDDETCFTWVDGWVISGSRDAVDAYVSTNAADYTLNDLLSDAGKGGLLSARPVVALAYFSFTEDRDETASLLKPSLMRLLSQTTRNEYSSAVLSIGQDGRRMSSILELCGLSLKKTKAPAFERDTTVVVPAGPFKVRNSHTGKTNTFYQNSSKAICLRDENGKDLWGVPFDKSLCGTAHNVDYYANGKLQIIFGAGSSIYLIDRLGRYVSGFPLDLGRDIALGPDVYDFSGARKYNIMVLHKDNTVEMYNLKGKKPEAWKGITAPETIKSLPQRLTVGGKDFWVVRTSIQTLIFPFYGGSPVTKFDGDSKIKPDSIVKILDSTSVEVECYDGKSRNIKLK